MKAATERGGPQASPMETSPEPAAMPGATRQATEHNERPLAGSSGEERAEDVSDIVRQRRDAYLAQVPRKYRGHYRRAYAGRSLRAAVVAKCLDCTNWQRKEVALCPCVDCPLYPYRPYGSAGGDE